MGDIRYDNRGAAVTVSGLVAPTWPAYAAGLDEDDHLQELDGQRINADTDVRTVLAKHQPGDTITIAFTNRLGRSINGLVKLAASPHVEVVPIEAAGGKPTEAQRAFRDRWLGPK
jgi:S1-C subfamily serine protease